MIENFDYVKSCNIVVIGHLPLQINREEINLWVEVGGKEDPALGLHVRFQGIDDGFHVILDSIPWQSIPEVDIPISIFFNADPQEALEYFLSKVLASVGEAQLMISYEKGKEQFQFTLSIDSFKTVGELSLASITAVESA